MMGMMMLMPAFSVVLYLPNRSITMASLWRTMRTPLIIITAVNAKKIVAIMVVGSIGEMFCDEN
jgi:hypothetical protein